MAGWTKELADIAKVAMKESKVVRPIERQVAEKEAAAAAEKAAAADAATQQAAAPAAAPAPQLHTAPVQAEAAAAEAQGAAAAGGRLSPPEPAQPALQGQAVTPETQAAAELTGSAEAPKPTGAAPAAGAAAPSAAPAPGAAAAPKPLLGLEPITAETATPEARAAAMSDLNRLSQADLGHYALDERHMPNFDYIEGSDSLKATMADLAEQNKARVTEAQRGTMTWEQSQALADEINIQPDAVPQVLGRLLGRTANVEDILAARQMLASSADRLQQFAAKHGRGELNPSELLDFMRQLQMHRELYINYRGNVTEVARTLNVLRKPVGSDPAMVARMNEMITRFGGDIDNVAAAIRMTNSVKGVTDIAKGATIYRTGRAAWNTLNRVFVNGILSGPVTHAVNFGGNVMIGGMQMVEGMAASAWGRVLNTSERATLDETMAMAHAYMHATNDALRMASRVVKTGETLDHVLKFDTGGVRTTDILPELNTGLAGDLRIGKIANVVDAVIDAPTARALAASDELFKVLHYRAELSRQVWREAQKGIEAGQLDANNLGAFVRNMMENPTPEMEKIAEDFSRVSTFQNPMGATGAALNQLVKSVPPLKLIMPFIRTPVNIFHEALGKRTPLALATKSFWADVRAGGRARDLAMARISMGTAMTGLVAYMTLDGKITGNGPMNPAARATLLASGWQPYSVRIFNPSTNAYEYHSYARMEPFASIIGVVADAMEIKTYAMDYSNPLADDDQQLNTVMASVVAAVMNNTLNKTFMKGLSDFVDMANNPQQQAMSWARNFGASMLPYSAALRTIKNFNDPLLRDARTTLDKMRSGIPGMSEDLPGLHFLFGEDRTVKSGGLLGVLSPMPSTEESQDPVYTELRSLMHSTNMAPVTMPKRRIDQINLTPDEYEKYILYSRTNKWFDDGTKTLHDKIADTIKTPEYRDMTPDARALTIHQYQQAADRQAAAMLESRDPQYAVRVSNLRRIKARLKGQQ